MLELHINNSIQEIENLKDFVTVAYVIIDDIYKKVTPTHIANRCNIKDSIMSDCEVITISIVGELLTIDSEKAKSLWGLLTRIKTKLLACKLCYFINMLLGKDINYSKIKHLIFG